MPRELNVISELQVLQIILQHKNNTLGFVIQLHKKGYQMVHITSMSAST